MAVFFLLALGSLVTAGAWIAPGVMDRLAASDPDPTRLVRLDGLRVTRALLRAPEEGGLLWQARTSASACGFFLGGAARAERLGQIETAQLWLALERLGRGDRAGARAMLNSAGKGLTLPAAFDPARAASWENEALGWRLRQSLAK